jgi:hypothetical protein
MTLSSNLNNLLTNLDLPKQCSVCKTIYKDIKNNFVITRKHKDGYSYECKKCKDKRQFKYANTEIGFLTNYYNTINNRHKNHRYKNLSEKEIEHHKCTLTKEEFFQLWEEHKKQFGYHCQLTGVKMVLQRAKDPKKRKFTGYLNAMSVDRLDSTKGYTKDNIIFISNEANKIKGAVTKQLCIKILEIYKEKGL